jgi:hypothetical protein
MQGWVNFDVRGEHAMVVFRHLDAAGIKRGEQAAWQGNTIVFTDIEPEIQTLVLIVESKTHRGYASVRIDGVEVARCIMMDEMSEDELELCRLHRDTNGEWYVEHSLPQWTVCG